MGGLSNSMLVLALLFEYVLGLALLLPTLEFSTVVDVFFLFSDVLFVEDAVLFETFCLIASRDLDGKFIKNFPTKRTSSCRGACW
jgi:hypothetical protein